MAQKITQKQIEYPVQKILYSGGSYMNATQTANLSENVLDQPTGIILVWSTYASSLPQDYGWNYVHIPKFHVQNHNGQGVAMTLQDGTNSTDGFYFKYVYIYNDKITGNAINSSFNRNARSVLRYVLGY